MPKVSVVIPVYNSERYVSECLESVMSQTLEDIEIICVDDGSTDGSLGILREHARRDSRVVVIESSHHGVSASRNTGLDASSGEYVIFLDSDDFFEPTMLQDVFAQCEKHDAEIGVFKYRRLQADAETATEADWSLRMDLVPEKAPFSRRDMTDSILRLTTPCIWNKMFSRSFIDDARLRFWTDLERAEDVPFSYLALLTAHRIVAVDEVYVNYRTGYENSNQATVHMGPTDICVALVRAKEGAIEAGVFAECERDLVNAALDQCLFTLGTVRTASAYHELFEALKTKYFTELGIAGRDRSYFFTPGQYDHLQQIMSLSAEEYLLLSARSFEDQAPETGGWLERATWNTATAESRAGALTALLMDEARVLRSELAEVRDELLDATNELEEARGRLEEARSSLTYRIGRGLGVVPRAVRKMTRSNRKAV